MPNQAKKFTDSYKDQINIWPNCVFSSKMCYFLLKSGVFLVKIGYFLGKITQRGSDSISDYQILWIKNTKNGSTIVHSIPKWKNESKNG